MNLARQGKTTCGSHAAQHPGPLGRERKGSNDEQCVKQGKTAKSADTEGPPGGMATKDGAVPKIGSQARKMVCGPATAPKRPEHTEWQCKT